MFLDSQPWFIRRELLGDVERNVPAGVEDDYTYLEEQNIVHIESPDTVIDEYDQFLTANVANDIRDTSFCEVGIKHDVTVWRVLRERIPPSFLEVFYPGAGSFQEAISLQALVKAEGSLDKLEEGLRRFAQFRWKNVRPDELWEIFLARYRFVISGNPHIALESYGIPFLQASSLRINEALLICALKGYVPFTDSRVHDRMMNIKVNRSLSFVAQNESLREQLELGVTPALPYQHLALAVLNRLISDEELAKRSVRDLVEYRGANQGQLDRMRISLGSLAQVRHGAVREPANPFRISLGDHRVCTTF